MTYNRKTARQLIRNIGVPDELRYEKNNLISIKISRVTDLKISESFNQSVFNG